MANLGNIQYTAGLEITDKVLKTAGRNTIRLDLLDNGNKGLPQNNPKEAVKWIATNRPSTLYLYLGMTSYDENLGSGLITPTITYGSGELNSQATNSQYIRTNKY